MNRRESLRIITAALGGMAFDPSLAAAPGDRVDWTDVALLDGRRLPSAALTGRVVVVEIWASWCPFCAQQNPLLQQLYDAQRGHGLDVLTFSIDRDPAKARAYMTRHRYTFPAAMATRQSEKWFGPRVGLPETYVVDRDGRIVFKETREMLADDVRELARFAQS
ncbi:MAG TPA: TlpA disulfide reductase family protein [Casimicrobiaceae bacterium]|nr:TlpA disulfide reductase family protein [Casimicrobiaceae bacterium]